MLLNNQGLAGTLHLWIPKRQKSNGYILSAVGGKSRSAEFAANFEAKRGLVARRPATPGRVGNPTSPGDRPTQKAFR
jgi:hypothetical protein